MSWIGFFGRSVDFTFLSFIDYGSKIARLQFPFPVYALKKKKRMSAVSMWLLHREHNEILSDEPRV